MNDDGTAKQYPFTIQAGKAEATVGVNIDLGLIENDTITPGEGGDIDLGSVTIEKSVLNAAGKLSQQTEPLSTQVSSPRTRMVLTHL